METCDVCGDKSDKHWHTNDDKLTLCTKCIMPHSYAYFGWAYWPVLKRRLIGLWKKLWAGNIKK